MPHRSTSISASRISPTSWRICRARTRRRAGGCCSPAPSRARSAASRCGRFRATTHRHRPGSEAVVRVSRGARGTGLGRALAHAVLAHARAIGYRELKLDTLSTMSEARALYASLGFRECAAYYHNPLGGTVYMALRLS